MVTSSLRNANKTKSLNKTTYIFPMAFFAISLWIFR